MASVNKAIVLGNLGRDPEVRYAADGSSVANVAIATSRQWKDKTSGERKEETEWHRVVFYGRLAEVVGEYCKKGSSVYVEGRLKTRKWSDKEGIERYTTEIVGEQLQMLGGTGKPESKPEPEKTKPVIKETPKQPSTDFDDMDDDIPF